MYQKIFKRLIDLLVSLIAIPVVLIVIIIIGVFIKIEDRGPIIYRSVRLGRDGKVFNMYKLRSMNIGAPIIFNEDGSTYNSSTDPRVTRIGKFIRETSIDELPQIFNVIKGDMSLVGPRASLENVRHTFKEDELDKFKVRPGITGYTQAYYRNGLSSREKRLKDAWYANNVSFILDMKIFFKTIITVLKRDAIYTNSEPNYGYDKKYGHNNRC